MLLVVEALVDVEVPELVEVPVLECVLVVIVSPEDDEVPTETVLDVPEVVEALVLVAVELVVPDVVELLTPEDVLAPVELEVPD